MVLIDPELWERCHKAVQKPFRFGGVLLAAEAVGLAITHAGASYFGIGALEDGLKAVGCDENERKSAKQAGQAAAASTTALVVGGAAQAASVGGGIAIGNFLASMGSAISFGACTGVAGAALGAAGAIMIGPVAAVSAGCATIALIRVGRRSLSTTS